MSINYAEIRATLLIIGLCVFIALAIVFIISEKLMDRNDDMIKQFNRKRRAELIKELRTGYLNKSEACQKLRELHDLMNDQWFVQYDSRIGQNDAGLWVLKTLETDYYSWI